MYKYILFDFDGTVFDTVEGITKSVRYAINKRGMDAPLDSLRCFAGPPLVDMYMEHFGGTPEEADQFVRDFRKDAERNLPADPKRTISRKSRAYLRHTFFAYSADISLVYDSHLPLSHSLTHIIISDIIAVVYIFCKNIRKFIY